MFRTVSLRAVGSPARRVVSVNATATVPSQFSSLAPVGERVFVKVGEVEDVSAGGILLPSSAVKKPTAGEVVGAAADCKSVKAGDRVVYSKYAGTEVELKGDEYVLLKEEDCIGLMGSDSVKDLKPLGDRLLVKVAEVADRTSGGVILSGAAEKPTIGEVVAVGPGRMQGEENKEMVPVAIKAGSSVLYSKYSGVELEGDDGTAYIVVREGDILAVLS